MSPQPATGPSVDVVVVGGGFAGMYAIHALRERGLDVQGFETGSDVGGTWYWNRYPGARCDVESLDYQYGFDPTANEGWSWTERYATQPEILAYASWMAEKLEVRQAIRFDTTVTSARFDEDTAWWHVHTSDGALTRARFIIAASGSISATSVPPFPGADTFTGTSLHPGAWPHEGIDLTGARVAVIGVGSSGVQLIPELATQVAELTVFQRTPAYTIPARNRPLYPDELIRAQHDAARLQEFRAHSPAGLSTPFTTLTLLATPEPERSRRLDEAWKLGGNQFLTAFSDAPVDELANEAVADYVRARIAEIVKDPHTAERLTPRDYPIGAKRIVTDTNFYATFNQPHVHLVDVREDPIESITPSGITTRSGEHEFDVIVYATGYDNLTGALTRVDYVGREESRLSAAWAEGARTYLGIMASGFPNLFMITGPQSPSVLVNMFAAIEQHVEWAIDTIMRVGAEGATLEPLPAAEEAWGVEVDALLDHTLYPKASSWYHGQNIEGKPTRTLVYAGGLDRYRTRCEQESAAGFPGFALRLAPGQSPAEPSVAQRHTTPKATPVH